MKQQIQKPKRKFKTTVINLLGGKQRRIEKAEVVDIQEQFTLGGGLDIVLVMKSGQQYIVDMTKDQVQIKINS
jgi:hypothetical protein